MPSIFFQFLECATVSFFFFYFFERKLFLSRFCSYLKIVYLVQGTGDATSGAAGMSYDYV